MRRAGEATSPSSAEPGAHAGDALARARDAYFAALVDTDRRVALAAVDRALVDGVSPEDVVFGVIIPSIERMTAEAARGEGVSLAQHFLAARIAAEVTEAMMPRFSGARVPVGRAVLGNAAQDFHGLGRRIVAGCLRALDVEFVDLGLDVSAARFVDAAVDCDARVIGVSSMMVHTARGPGGPLAVRRLLAERGLEARVRLVVGGAPYRFDPGLWRVVGADATAENGLEAARLIRELVTEVVS